MKYPRTIFTVLLVSVLNNVAFAQPDVELVKTAIPEIQSQIRTTALAFLSRGNSELEAKTNWKGFRELTKLKELANNEQQLVIQLAIYAVIEQREEQWQVMEALLVLQLLNLKPSIPIRVLAPHLDSDNPQIRELARKWFESHDIRRRGVLPKPSVNYQDYFRYVCKRRIANQEVPTAFIEYLYERSPDQAMLVFYCADQQDESIARLIEIRNNLEASQQEREKNGLETLPLSPVREPPDEVPQQRDKKLPKEILLAEHMISNVIWLSENGFDEEFHKALPAAKQQLSMLSKYDKWWARLYVAEIMRRHRELRLREVLEKLSNDDNPLVCKSAKSVKG